jgi:hypothetical protein
MTGNYGPSFLFGPAIGGAIGEGIQQGRQANMLALASQAAQRGDYAGLGNALLQLGDVSGALAALKTPEEQRRTRALEQRQAAIDELNRRNIESEMKAREAAVGARDLRAVGDKVVDFSDPNNPRVVYSTPTLANELGVGGGQPTSQPMPSNVMPSPEVAQTFGPRVSTQPLLTPGGVRGDYAGGTVGVTPSPKRRTMADITQEEKLTAAQMDAVKAGSGRQYLVDLLSGKPLEGEKPPTGYRNIYDDVGNIVRQEPIAGGPATQPSGESRQRAKLAESYLSYAPDLRKKITTLFGPGSNEGMNRTLLLAGRGEPGNLYLDMQSGIEAFERAMTGANMPPAETADYGARYRLSSFDDYPRMLAKFDRLGRDLKAISNIDPNSPDAANQARAILNKPDQGQAAPAGPAQQGGTQTVGPRGQAAPRLTQEQYNAAKPGTLFIAVDDPSGTVRIKQ